MFEHLPKINIGLACVVLLCFFLPWISFSCGTVEFLKLSGFSLAMGKVPLDETGIRQYQQLGGDVSTDSRIPPELRQAEPNYAYFVVPFCALVALGCSVRMMSGGMTKFMVFTAMGAGALGSLFLIGAGIAEFGLEVPPGTAIVIQSSFEPGYFLSVIAMLLCTALPIPLLQAVEQSRVSPASFQPAPVEERPEFVGRQEEVSPEMAQFFGVESEKKKATEPEMRPTLPPGTKACPTCGVAVGAYQVKCLKCGGAIKPDKRK